MTRSGVTLADALVVGYRTVSHGKLRKELQSLQRRLVEGGQLARLIEEVSALPLPVRKLLIAAERSGDPKRPSTAWPTTWPKKWSVAARGRWRCSNPD